VALNIPFAFIAGPHPDASRRSEHGETAFEVDLDRHIQRGRRIVLPLPATSRSVAFARAALKQELDMSAQTQMVYSTIRQTHRDLRRRRSDAVPPALRTPRWNAVRRAFDAGFSAADVSYMLDLSEDELHDYFRNQRELPC
jgi:DNA-binding NarL/FixJ family response regulator